MNSEQNELSVGDMYENGSIYTILCDYLNFCDPSEENTSEANKPTGNSKAQKSKKTSFPNLAGFCRYIGIGIDEFFRLSASYPEHSGRILTVLEDEALNSGVSASLLSAYLKKRLGYGSTESPQSPEQQLCISFEHDIFEDGE